MNLVKSLVIVAGSGGIVSTGAYLTRDSWMPKREEKNKSGENVSKVLVKAKYKPLDTAKMEGWDAVLRKYNEVYSTSKKQISDLQQECKTLLNKEEFSDSDYQKARRWCVEIQSVSNRLGLFGKNALPTDNGVSTHDGKWREKISSHTTTHPNKLNSALGGEEPANLTAIKSECSALNSKQSTDENFERDFSKSLEWCSVNS